jgi:hypothetical protein
MANRKDIYNLIPPDQLHWNDQEQNFIALSDKEIDSTILQYVQGTADFDINNIHRVVQAMTFLKVGKLLFDRFAEGKIKISGIDENNELIFSASDE